MSSKPKPIEIFVSYSHKDERWRKELADHLSSLEDQKQVAIWHDHKIGPGTEWEKEIDEHLNTSSIILLLISRNFMASHYCKGIEMKRAMERRGSGDARVIPILLHAVDIKKTLIEVLNPLPTNKKAITSWTNRHEAFTNVAKGIREAVEELIANQDLDPTPPIDTTQVNPLASKEEEKSASNEGLNSTPPVSSTPVNQNTAPEPIWNVPYSQNPFFTGRDDILDELYTALKAGVTRPQAISGLGGIGKTQIAIEYAYRHRSNYQTILWVNADSREVLDSELATIADLLKLLPNKDMQDQNSAVGAVKHWLEESTDWLLILDNVEDLALVHDFIPTTSSGHVLLITTNQTMGTVAQGHKIEKMSSQDGASFILQRAKLINSTGNSSAADRVKAEEISSAMDGLPLALDQAAAYVDGTGCGLNHYLNLYKTRCTDLLKRRGTLSLSNHPESVAAARRSTLSPSNHPESVAATWSLSFDKVKEKSEAAAELLQLCAFLSSDPIRIETINAGASALGPILEPVAADQIKLDNAIEELRKFSLVSRDRQTETLTVHRLMKSVLKDGMTPKIRSLWAKRSIEAINQAVPEIKLESDKAKTHRTLGNYAEAVSSYKKVLTSYEKYLGTEHPDLITSLNNLADLYYLQGNYPQAEQYYMRTRETCERAHMPHYPTMVNCLNNMAKIYCAQGRYKEAETHCKEAMKICEQAQKSTQPCMAVCLHTLARLYHVQGKYKEAEASYKKTLAYYKQAQEINYSEVAVCLNELARLYYDKGSYTQAEQHYQEAVNILKDMFGENNLTMAASKNGFGEISYTRAYYSNARLFYEEALNIRKHILGQKHPETAASFNNLADLYRTLGMHQQAKSFYQQALDIRKATLGQNHPEVAASLNSLAELYYIQGEYTQAERHLLRSLRIRRRVLEPDHPDLATSWNNLAELYLALGKDTQAEQHLLSAQRIWEKTLSPKHPLMATNLASRARLYHLRGNYEEAEKLYTEALTIRKQALGPRHDQVATILNDMAELYYEKGKRTYAKAEQYYKQAQSIYEQTLGFSHPRVATSLSNLAKLNATRGWYNEAKPLYVRALAIFEQALGLEHPNTKAVLSNYTDLLRKMNRAPEAEELLRRAEKIRQKHIEAPKNPRSQQPTRPDDQKGA